MENLSATLACRGKISEISNASDLVRIGLKGPRISRGAFGLGSQVSSWLGAPKLKIMIALLLSFGFCDLWAARRP